MGHGLGHFLSILGQPANLEGLGGVIKFQPPYHFSTSPLPSGLNSRQGPLYNPASPPDHAVYTPRKKRPHHRRIEVKISPLAIITIEPSL